MPSAPAALPTLREIIDRHLNRADPRVLTAHDHLDVPVGWVHSSEIFEIGPLLSGGELLLTTGLGLGGLDAGTRRHYIRDLAERGVAGLAFETGRTFNAVPEEMVREASARRLPIVELRRVLPFIEVCREANTSIVTGELAGLRSRALLDDALHDDLLAPGAVARMLAHVSESTGRPIALIGSGGALLAAHGVDDDRSAWRLVDAAVASAPVIARDREIARLVAGRGSNGHPPPVVTMMLAAASGPVAAALTRSGTRGSAVGTQLVEEIVAGRHVRRADLVARLASSGFPIADTTRLVTVAAEAPDPRMAEAALARSASALPGLVQATIDATVYAVVAVTAAGHGDDPVELVAGALAGLGAQAGRVTAVVGDAYRLSSANADVDLSATLATSLHRSAERLSIAVESMRVGVTDRRIVTGRELIADSAVRGADPQVRNELRQLIAPLIAHDQNQSTQLVATLDVHLRHGCSATRSAEVLHLGRQSLYQRLDRIRGLLGFDPTSPAIYPSMLLAVSAFRSRSTVASVPR
ncbi:PucR family transcriptional regulator [Gordonia sp. SID5947]|uniref:PucR family transcriptional regulator n=1 Tax=Gordonia sp. SID5947 TaxID=2690315 RepID=UPI001368D947|nr:PucR family transcriptional regulator [Gordonia sp. SID5947]MYR04903.1 PucR family transcriptional regulator [Gordonia sp. SID5947]